MRFTLLVCALISIHHAHASPSIIEVNLGDRITKVQLQDEDKKFIMAIGSNDFRERKTNLGETNFLYIEKRLADMAKLGSRKDSCERDRVEVKKQENGAWVSRFQVCLLEDSERAESMRSLLNTLSIAY